MCPFVGSTQPPAVEHIGRRPGPVQYRSHHVNRPAVRPADLCMAGSGFGRSEQGERRFLPPPPGQSAGREAGRFTFGWPMRLAGSTITVDGTAVVSANASSPIALIVGANQIDVVVTASDPRFTETYTVTITRAAPVSVAVPGGGGGGSFNDDGRDGENQKQPGPGNRDFPDPGPSLTRPETPVTIDPITTAPPEGDDWDTETMRIVDPVTEQEQTKVVTPDGTWELDTRSGLVNFTPADGFFGRAEVEFVVTTMKGVTYRARLSVYVAQLGPTLPITGTESQTPLIWGMWLVVVGILAGALSRRRLF